MVFLFCFVFDLHYLCTVIVVGVQRVFAYLFNEPIKQLHYEHFSYKQNIIWGHKQKNPPQTLKKESTGETPLVGVDGFEPPTLCL